jgi:hypothetical protein
VGVEQGHAAPVGAVLRAARQRRRLSLRAAAARCAISKSALHRLETGEAELADDDLLVALDAGLDAHGELVGEVTRVWRPPAEPGPRGTWVHVHPARWVGPVWVDVDPGAAGVPVAVTVCWGPWRADLVVDGDGPTALVHAKGLESPAAPLAVTVEPAARVGFGIGQPPADRRRRELPLAWSPDGGDRVAAAALRGLLAQAGRSVGECAAFFRLPEEKVRVLLREEDAASPEARGGTWSPCP